MKSVRSFNRGPFVSQRLRFLGTPITGTSCVLEAKLDGVTWTDISADRTTAEMQIEYGHSSNGPTDLLAASGHWTFSLNNASTNSGSTQGWYALDSSTTRTGWATGVACRLTIIANGSSYYKFLGRIDSVDPVPGVYAGDQTVLVTVTDWLDDASRTLVSGTTTQQGKTGDQLISALLGAVASGTYYRTITIDHTKVGSSTLTNFPVLFTGDSTTDTWLKSVDNSGKVASSNGYDILFYADANFSIPLSFERVKWSATAGVYTFWINVPSISASVDTVIYVTYGDTAVNSDQQNPDGCWTTYTGAWHLEDGTTLSGADATGSGYPLTINGATAVAAKVGGGASFNGTTDSLTQAFPFFADQNYTVSLWAYAASTSGGSHTMYEGGRASNNYVSQLRRTGTDWEFYQKDGGGSDLVAKDTGGVSATTWTHIAGTYDGANLKIYRNGVLKATTACSSMFFTPAETSFGVNVDDGNINYWNGRLDELRIIAATALPVGWLLAEYNNQNSPSTFTTVGAEVNTSTVTPISGPAATSFGTGADTYPFALDDLKPEESTVYEAMNKIAASGYDRIFMKGDSATGGVLVYEPRLTRQTAASAVVTLTDTVPGTKPGQALEALALRRGRQNAPNQIRCTVHPRGNDGSNVVIYTLPIDVVANRQSVANGSQMVLNCQYTNPNQQAQTIGASSVVTPAATTDWLFNSAANGSGSNLTGSMAVTISTLSGNASRVTFTNNSDSTAYLTFFQIRGKGLYTNQPQICSADDTLSQAKGKNRITLDMPYQSSVSVGTTVAQAILTQRSTERSQIDSAGVWCSQLEGDTMNTLVRVEPSTAVNITETMTGVTNLPFWVDKVQLRIDERDNVGFSFLLEPRVSV